MDAILDLIAYQPLYGAAAAVLVVIFLGTVLKHAIKWSAIVFLSLLAYGTFLHQESQDIHVRAKIIGSKLVEGSKKVGAQVGARVLEGAAHMRDALQERLAQGDDQEEAEESDHEGPPIP